MIHPHTLALIIWIGNLVVWIACGAPVMTAVSGFILGLIVAQIAHEHWGRP